MLSFFSQLKPGLNEAPPLFHILQGSDCLFVELRQGGWLIDRLGKSTACQSQLFCYLTTSEQDTLYLIYPKRNTNPLRGFMWSQPAALTVFSIQYYSLTKQIHSGLYYKWIFQGNDDIKQAEENLKDQYFYAVSVEEIIYIYLHINKTVLSRNLPLKPLFWVPSYSSIAWPC